MKRNANTNAGLIYDFTRAVYCVKTNTADTEAKYTNTPTKKKIFQKVPSFWHSTRVGFIKQNVMG
jgi:hypothetical protein